MEVLFCKSPSKFAMALHKGHIAVLWKEHYENIETTILIKLHVQITSFHYNLHWFYFYYNVTYITVPVIRYCLRIQCMYYMQRRIILGGLYSTLK